MDMKFKILSIEDDEELQYCIKKMLLQNGYKFFAAKNGRNGISQIVSGCPDLVLLDLGLPDMDGIDILKQMKKWSDCSVIVVSSRKMDKDKIQALDAGADDYVTKPFSTDELMARIRASLRRRKVSGGIYPYEAKELKIDFERRLIFLKGKQVHLTPMEYHIMEYIAMNSGRVITYRMLLEKIWGPYASENNKILRVNMANIRRKIEANPANPEYLITEAGVGYRMMESDKP